MVVSKLNTTREQELFNKVNWSDTKTENAEKAQQIRQQQMKLS